MQEQHKKQSLNFKVLPIETLLDGSYLVSLFSSDNFHYCELEDVYFDLLTPRAKVEICKKSQCLGKGGGRIIMACFHAGRYLLIIVSKITVYGLGFYFKEIFGF